MNSEAVFISPTGRVTVNLCTCFSLDVEKTPDLGVAIRYELTGTSQTLYVIGTLSQGDCAIMFT